MNSIFKRKYENGNKDVQLLPGKPKERNRGRSVRVKSKKKEDN